MMISYYRYLALLGVVIAVNGAGAQTPAADPSAKLREVLPADVAERVLGRIAAARARELPAAALENRALKFAAKGVAPGDIERSVSEHADRMQRTKDAIEKARRGKASADEVEAGAEAMRRGVEGVQVGVLAKSAPSGRSLAVPLFVIGSLIDRGLPSDSALRRVQTRLQARASDRELEQMPANVAGARRPMESPVGQEMAAKRPADVGARPGGGPPPGVPGNAGKDVSPSQGRGKKP